MSTTRSSQKNELRWWKRYDCHVRTMTDLEQFCNANQPYCEPCFIRHSIWTQDLDLCQYEAIYWRRAVSTLIVLESCTPCITVCLLNSTQIFRVKKCLTRPCLLSPRSSRVLRVVLLPQEHTSTICFSPPRQPPTCMYERVSKTWAQIILNQSSSESYLIN